jgi:short-subunit dehydrogenase
VTGASSGIGESFARALRARGERLVLVARRADRLARLAAELGGEDAVLPVTLDLARPDAAASLQRTLEARGIGVSLLVNNAGVGYSGRVHEQAPERLRAMIDLNVRAVVELTRAFVPGMIERGGGAVLNVVSMSAFQPVPFLAVYAASKAFALSLAESMATELEGTGVTVQALCPGTSRPSSRAWRGPPTVKFTDAGPTPGEGRGLAGRPRPGEAPRDPPFGTGSRSAPALRSSLLGPARGGSSSGHLPVVGRA